MDKGRTTTIFRQLVFNIVIPTLLALLVLAACNFHRTRNLFRNHLAEKNEMLLRKLAEWKGRNDQVDDILVIGIKI